MEENFKIEVIAPEKIVFSDNVISVTLPSYEGNMSILKNHISIITFLRPGIIKIENHNNMLEEFFVQDGTVEFFENKLIVLSSSTISLKDLSKSFIDNLNNDTKNKLLQKNITDRDRYLLNHKLDTLKEIRI
jgi:ATP synthase F1 epsilon subunit